MRQPSFGRQVVVEVSLQLKGARNLVGEEAHALFGGHRGDLFHALHERRIAPLQLDHEGADHRIERAHELGAEGLIDLKAHMEGALVYPPVRLVQFDPELRDIAVRGQAEAGHDLLDLFLVTEGGLERLLGTLQRRLIEAQLFETSPCLAASLHFVGSIRRARLHRGCKNVAHKGVELAQRVASQWPRDNERQCAAREAAEINIAVRHGVPSNCRMRR
jgi:hypothetical protein